MLLDSLQGANSPVTESIWPKMSIVPRSRKPTLSPFFWKEGPSLHKPRVGKEKKDKQKDETSAVPPDPGSPSG